MARFLSEIRARLGGLALVGLGFRANAPVLETAAWGQRRDRRTGDRRRERPGFAATATNGEGGKNGAAGEGIGGLFLTPGGVATIDNTTVMGNHATTSNDDVSNTITI